MIMHKIFIIAIVTSMLFTVLLAQDEISPVQLPEGPQFYFDALSFWNDQSGNARLDVYIEIPYEAVQFTKENDIFRATCEITIVITDSADHHLTEKAWNEKIETKDFNQSISPKTSDLIQLSFPLSAGAYFVTVQVQDNETKKTSSIKRKVIARDFSTGSFCLSDLMIVNSVTTEAGKKVISPNISGNVGELKNGFYLFFEVYDHVVHDSAKLWINIRDLKGDIIQHDSAWQRLGSAKNSCIQWVRSSQLSTGDYFIEVLMMPVSKTDSTAGVSGSRPFMIRWWGQPVSITELDAAIDQLQYIADREKIDTMKNTSPEQRREMFREFWKKKDPTPNSERNELMEEYYARVAYANKHFSHYIIGWKTDMGMVYIIFGPPSNIERHPFDIDAKPYEVWTYYEQNREFIFVDATGFGDYSLQNPIWDVWRTRPR
jgi:GWxTD domain-containing protein